MQDLQLIGVHEDGEHLLLSGPEDERFQIPVNEALRAAVRRDRPHFGRQQIESDGELRPRDVQAMIRAGASSDEAATRAGWSVEKVHRYEGPILAEREHVAGLAQEARVRTQLGAATGGSATTLSDRVVERLRARDVEVTEASWDSWRNEGGPWTVVLTFAAGGRQRQASWSFDLADRTVSAVDDEARWLSEEVREVKGPIPAPPLRFTPGRETTVYDVEAEGGMRPSVRDERQDDPLDLMTAMRRRSTARGRGKPGRRGASSGSPVAAGGAPAATADEAEQTSLIDVDHDTSLVVPPVGTPLVETDPSKSPPVETPAVTSHPVESRPVETHPVRSRPVETHPARSQPVETHPAQSQPVDTHPIQSRPDAAHREVAHRPAAEPAASLTLHGDPVATSEVSPGSEGSHQGESPTGNEPSQGWPSEGESQVAPKKAARAAARKTGRPSVPAWDEIMFGSRPNVNRSSS